jgi:hypothetical protein
VVVTVVPEQAVLAGLNVHDILAKPIHGAALLVALARAAAHNQKVNRLERDTHGRRRNPGN